MSTAPTITTKIAVPPRDSADSSRTANVVKISVRNLDFYYGKAQALHDVSSRFRNE